MIYEQTLNLINLESTNLFPSQMYNTFRAEELFNLLDYNP